MAIDYIVYGGDHSLFTGKVRAYMRFKNLNWAEHTATRKVYRKRIIPAIGAPIVPVLATADGEYVQDTTDIIDFLEARHPQASVYPSAPRQRLVALLFELFGDEWLVIPAMHYRWSVLDQQRDFILSEFGRMSDPEASFVEQIAIGERTSRVFADMLPALGVTQSTIPGIEAEYLRILDLLDVHFSCHDFLLGSRPCIGDYGLMGPLYAHLGRDPVPKALMQARAPNVFAWVERMNAPKPLAGEFLPDDSVPDTLLPILESQCRDQLPDVLDVIQHNSAWLSANPGGSIPRFLGMHPFRFGDAHGERVI
ncbi:MAG: glutathione S-transferase, partial [Halioglobus sp.]|nr:glutathione S-transferase [Halioglobus sp.]